MNAGIISILMHQCPYQFNGLQVISTIGFTLDLVLYIIFSTLFILHFLLYRRRAFNELIASVPDLCFLPCWSIAWMTLVAFVSLTVSNAKWGGHAFTILAVVMWWIVAVWIFLMLFFCFVTLIRHHTILDHHLPAAIIIPAVGVATLAAVGGLLTTEAYDLSPRLAVPIIITSFCANGVGVILAVILYTFLFHQLLAKGWPPALQTPTIFILIGPTGQCAAALQLLGAAADTHKRFAEYNSGIFLTAQAAQPLHMACILLALLLTGLGFVWLFLCICAMLDRAYHRELVWTPAWNAVIFPTGTLATSTTLFATEMDSPFFRVITVILLLGLITVFFVNVTFTVRKIWKGQLLIVREDWRVKEEIEGLRKER